MTWDDVRARRLARSRLTERADADELVDVARDVCGIHAQVQASAELQLAIRVDDLTRQGVRDALWRDRKLVKAWTVRGTLHLHPAGDLALWLAAARAVAPETEQPAWVDPKGVRHPALGLEELAELRTAVLNALDGRCLLRDELAAEVADRVAPKARRRLRSGFAFFGGANLCQGPPQGQKITLARPDQWVEGWREVDENEALREACRRFLRAYGPARPGDFREWISGSRTFTAAAAGALFESLSDELEEVEAADGRRGYVVKSDNAFPEPRRSLRLLPEYDVYVMGFRERKHLVPDTVREQVAAHGRGRYEGPAGVRFLLVDGVARGLWERKKRGKRLELRVQTARRLTRAQRAELDDEAERIGRFLGLQPALTVE